MWNVQHVVQSTLLLMKKNSKLLICRKGGVSMLHEELIERISDKTILDIAQRISASREAAQISSQEMADLVGLGYEQYRRLERGKVLVKTEYLYVIAQFLDVSVDYLLYGDKNEVEHRKISKILSGLSIDELQRASNILKAAFE